MHQRTGSYFGEFDLERDIPAEPNDDLGKLLLQEKAHIQGRILVPKDEQEVMLTLLVSKYGDMARRLSAVKRVLTDKGLEAVCDQMMDNLSGLQSRLEQRLSKLGMQKITDDRRAEITAKYDPASVKTSAVESAEANQPPEVSSLHIDSDEEPLEDTKEVEQSETTQASTTQKSDVKGIQISDEELKKEIQLIRQKIENHNAELKQQEDGMKALIAEVDDFITDIYSRAMESADYVKYKAISAATETRKLGRINRRLRNQYQSLAKLTNASADAKEAERLDGEVRKHFDKAAEYESQGEKLRHVRPEEDAELTPNPATFKKVDEEGRILSVEIETGDYAPLLVLYGKQVEQDGKPVFLYPLHALFTTKNGNRFAVNFKFGSTNPDVQMAEEAITQQCTLYAATFKRFGNPNSRYREYKVGYAEEERLRVEAAEKGLPPPPIYRKMVANTPDIKPADEAWERSNSVRQKLQEERDRKNRAEPSSSQPQSGPSNTAKAGKKRGKGKR